jgi:hypothetical protein
VVGGAAALGIKVSRPHVLALLPGASTCPQPSVNLGASSTWVVAELKKMQAAGEIPPGARITGVSKELANRMAKARPTKALKSRSIENILREMKLWPVTPTK